ncbi:glycosidase [Thiospirochaeta perfilievii]|uniref:Glycosidase n=1 Tax=Thiospirochaeta perfilievii TaxID=252967 RepID=A0A5C1QBQ1_9SPIO|nr:alpha-amylase family glycosyl hydrolase [Thiospirochaeta perfilievii]QEN04299.1 glycosidase [Thiospirochaeta perfilievii]
MGSKLDIPNGVMLNAYPDSLGGNLANINRVLKREELKGVFSSFYILPTLFESDLDRGFSVKSYNLNEDIVEPEDLEELKSMDINLKLDFVLNHLSVQSPQFRDILEKGDKSQYVDLFLDWNKFWDGNGELGSEGYIIPHEKYLSKLFMRKPGFPILKVPFPDGSFRFYWNTFYQSVIEPTLEGEKTKYLGQMDLNAKSPGVWEFYEDTFKKLSNYGAKIVRLDAFAYLHKEIGYSNFFNEPGTWDYLSRIKEIADRYNLVLLPEIHSKYEDKLHLKLAEKGYPIYDFFFPGLVIDMIESKNSEHLLSWVDEIVTEGLTTFNMLGCHDGIPLLDVKGLLNDQRIDQLMSIVKERGGRVKDLFGPDGKKISYYQINATFFSALGEEENKLLLARAIQIFMPGTPIVWYLDLFAGKNDIWAADNIGHKDINRTNLTTREIEDKLQDRVVLEQLRILNFRNTNRAFKNSPLLDVETSNVKRPIFKWSNGEFKAKLTIDLEENSFVIESKEPNKDWVLF